MALRRIRLDEYFLADLEIVKENDLIVELKANRVVKSFKEFSDFTQIRKFGELELRYNKMTNEIKVLNSNYDLTAGDKLTVFGFILNKDNKSSNGMRYKTADGYSFNKRK